MAELVRVPFEGESSGAGELTWGQLDIWGAMQRQRSALTFGGAFPLPPGTTVGQVAADLGYLMGRHDALRTRLRFAADGHPQQVVSKSGETALEVIDPGDDDPAEVGAGTYERYVDMGFDYERDWPMRWGVVARRGIASHLVSGICHIAADGMGAMALMRDLARRDPATGAAPGPVTAMQPLELVSLQRGPAAQRQNQAALRYWERTLRSVPARRLPESADRREPRYWQACLDSPAILLAAQIIAERCQVSTSIVVLAAYAAMLSRITGIDPAVVMVVVDNRFRRGLADVVSPMCSPTPCVIDIAGRGFIEVVTATWRTSLNAYKLAYYDPLQRVELEQRIGSERGEMVDTNCFLNDRRMQNLQEVQDLQEVPQRPPTADDVRAALGRSAFAWGWRRDQPNDKYFLSINNVPGTLCLDLYADTHWVAPADMEACLRGIESMIVETALGL